MFDSKTAILPDEVGAVAQAREFARTVAGPARLGMGFGAVPEVLKGTTDDRAKAQAAQLQDQIRNDLRLHTL